MEALLEQLQNHDGLRQLSLAQIISFVNCASMLKRDIMQPQTPSTSGDEAPKYLPPSVSHFLSESLGIPNRYMEDCWTIFKDVVWDHPSAEESKQADDEAFKVHGQKRGLSEDTIYHLSSESTTHNDIISVAKTIYPDPCICINPLCAHATKRMPMKKEEQRRVVIFTIADGACPAWSIHLYCASEFVQVDPVQMTLFMIHVSLTQSATQITIITSVYKMAFALTMAGCLAYSKSGSISL